MSKPVRLCANCKWMQNPGEWARCVCPKIAEKHANDPVVTGFEMPTTSQFAHTTRHIGGCGIEGKWWEQGVEVRVT